MPRKVLIIGGGISGLSLAWKLQEQGVETTILEAAPQIGGLSGTVRFGNYALDYGPHSFFTEDKEVLDVFTQIFNSALPPLTRRVKFYFGGRYVDYPLTANTVLTQMGMISSVQCLLSFAKAKLMTPRRVDPYVDDDVSVEDWAISSFGRHLYQTFFKPYTEQFWKIPCTELSARSIPSHTRTSFFNTLKVLLNKQVSEKGSTMIERERLPTYYPETGYGELPDRIAKKAMGLGAKKITSARVTGVIKKESGVLLQYVQDGTEKEIDGDWVVSTIPLNYFMQMLSPQAPVEVLKSAKSLDYRPLLVLGMVTEKQNILGESMYVYQMDRPYNRMFEANKFSPKTSPAGENILACEITCQRDGVVWESSKEELFEMCIGSLSEDGFISPGDVKKLLLVKAPYAYPIYRMNYAKHLKSVLDYVSQTSNISTLGRTGEFIYMDADKCMRRAFDFSRELLKQLSLNITSASSSH